jgi:hypothetical protein
MPTGGGSTGGGATPQAGFQARSENQIATTIASNTNSQAPVQAFVVASEVTNAQSALRNRVESNSF